MLKKVYFEGDVLIDLVDKKSTIFNFEYYVKEAINESGTEVGVEVSEIKKLSDIPDEWKDSIPYGNRKDEKTCIEIFNEEILPKLEIEDKKQEKFEFWKDKDKLQKNK